MHLFKTLAEKVKQFQDRRKYHCHKTDST